MMAEAIVEVRPFEIRYYCESRPEKSEKDSPPCGGNMQHTGQTVPVNQVTVLFTHQCPKCGAKKFLNKVYPILMGTAVNEPIPDQWLPHLDRTQIKDPPAPKGNGSGLIVTG